MSNTDMRSNGGFSLVDTHCHLDMDKYAGGAEGAIRRAKAAGVKTLITIGTDAESCEKAVSIARSYDGVYCAVGIHPHDARTYSDKVHQRLLSFAKEEKVVAIGETGLDYHYDHSPRDMQRKVMQRQIEASLEVGLPVIIHSRDADKDALDIIRGARVRRGVMHCFSGTMDIADKFMDMGLYISIAGPVTFKNAQTLKDVARHVPDDFLLIETDAPFLSPEPLRGKTNEPAHIVHTAKTIAQIRGVDLNDIARITTLNAYRLFGLGSTGAEGEIAYGIRDSLYLNITNRCTNDCPFCARLGDYMVKGHNLRLKSEPSVEELKTAIADPSVYKEIVFCGYGEPTLRIEVIKELGLWVKQNGGKVRLNTNGHGNLINKRNIIQELKDIIIAVSISLNAQDEQTYNRLCSPKFANAYGAVIEFIRDAVGHIPVVVATAVDAEGVDMEKCREIAKGLGVSFRPRKLNEVG